MANQKSDTPSLVSRIAGEQRTWKIAIWLTLGLLVLIAVLSLVMLAAQMAHNAGLPSALVLAGFVVCMTLADLVLTWVKLSPRWVPVAILGYLLALAAMGFTTGDGLAWAVADMSAILVWAASYGVARQLIGARAT